MLQLDRPPNARHWEEFKFLLKRAQKILPDSERVVAFMREHEGACMVVAALLYPGRGAVAPPSLR